MSVSLYHHQIEAVDSLLSKLESSNNALLAAPTGCGKTEMIINLIQTFKDLGLNITVMVNSVSLVENLHDRFLTNGIMSAVYCGTLNRRELSQVSIVSVDTFKNETRHKSDVIIIDEVHNVNDQDAESSFLRSIENTRTDSTKLIGFTATPFRATGTIYGAERLFDSIAHKIELSWLIQENFLVKPVVLSTQNEFETDKLKIKHGEWDQQDVEALVSNEEKLELQVVEALTRLEGRKKVFWQAANISHAQRIAARLVEKGEKVVVVVSKDITIRERQRLLKDFEQGETRHCVFVSILSEGYNYPPADALVLLRPIRSPVLYVQVCGRVLRTNPGKENALILDFGRVRATCGPLDKPIIRTKGEKKTTVDTEVWICKACYCYVEKQEAVCSNCGAEKEKRVSSPESNTTIKSDTSEMLSGWVETEKRKISVGKILLSKHISKSGNTCIKIVYQEATNSLFADSVPQYLTYTNHWAKLMSEKALYSIGLDGFSNVMNQIEQRGGVMVLVAKDNTPVLEYSYEGKYKKAGRLIADREGFRDANPKLPF